MLRYDFSILRSCQMPPSPRSLPARWCNGVCGSDPFSGNSTAQLHQVSLPQDADPLPRSSVWGALACGRAGVTWSASPLAAAARSVPHELASLISQKSSCRRRLCWAVGIGFTFLPVQALNYPENSLRLASEHATGRINHHNQPQPSGAGQGDGLPSRQL